jgi:phenylalanyl-tRNA synthetase beta chain
VLSLDLGYAEVKSYAFYGEKDAARLGLAATEHLRLVHPLSEEQDRLALASAVNLLGAARRNAAREPSVRIWESTRLVIPSREKGRLPTEVPVLGLLAWTREAGPDPSGKHVLGLVEDLRALFDRLGLPGVPAADAAGEPLVSGLPPPAWLHPGRRAVLGAPGAPLAVAGEVAPSVLRAFELPGRAAVAEVSLDALLRATAGAPPEYRPIHRYPVVPFDVAVVVPRRTPSARVAETIAGAAPGAVRSVALFDVYEGQGIPAGSRSLAFTCELLDAEKTLEPAAADALRARVRKALEAKGWSIRAADVSPGPRASRSPSS